MPRPATAILAGLTLLVAVSATAGEVAVGRFSAGDLSGWSEQLFKGKNSYTLVNDNGRTVLRAESRNSASGLLKKVAIDPKKLPLLRWSWKVAHTLGREDVTSKKGDDFAARVYVVFPRGLFWRTRAINYVWAAHLPRGASVRSPYTGNAMVVAVESGDGRAGTWVAEERNIYEDYRKLFGEEPPMVGAVALMSDTDNTGDEVTAWYGDITLGTPESVP